MDGAKIVGDNFVLLFSDSLDALPPVLILKEREGGMGEAGGREHMSTRCVALVQAGCGRKASLYRVKRVRGRARGLCVSHVRRTDLMHHVHVVF